jgi:hypothetical protein
MRSSASLALSPVRALPVRIPLGRSITHEAAGFDKLAPFIDGGDRIACGECDERIASTIEERIGSDNERANSRFHTSRERHLKILINACVQHMHPLLKRPRPRLNIPRDRRDSPFL